MSDTAARLAEAIAERHGLVARGDWHASIDRALGDMAVPADALEGPLEPALVERVAGALTVPETFFMRHHSQLEHVTGHLVARLREGASGLQVLSAGCSTGEEPYSLVLCLLRALGDFSGEQVCIRACDISPDAIARATDATYGSWSFRDVPDWLLERHFEVAGDGRFRLGEEIRARVRFRRESIAGQVASLGNASTDAVLFRNVGIYLSEAHLTHLYHEFRRVLRPGGLLVVAPSDPRPPRGLFERTDHDSTGVYRRSDGKAPEPAARRERRRRCAPASVAVRAPARGAGRGRDPGVQRLEAPARIRAMADAGDVPQAITHARRRVDARPGDADAHLLLGQMFLAGAREEDGRAAVEHIRRAVFLAPDHTLARFWYAHALIATGAARKAQAQLDVLGSLLDALPEDHRFEDAGVGVCELREARAFLLESVQ